MRAHMPGWPKGCTVYRDDLDEDQRRAHQIASLCRRARMLKAQSFKRPETILVASLAVLAWTADDMLACLTAAVARGAAVVALDAGLTIDATTPAAALSEAVAAFAEGRRKQQAVRRGEMGGKRSGDAREAEAKARAMLIKDRWCLPTRDYPTQDLLAEIGMSINTARKHLGSRPAVQRAYQAARKRAAKRAAKKEQKGG